MPSGRRRSSPTRAAKVSAVRLRSSGRHRGAQQFSRTHLAPRSYHPGGANASMADGSVRFVKNSINLPTWNALAPERVMRCSAPTHIDLITEVKY